MHVQAARHLHHATPLSSLYVVCGGATRCSTEMDALLQDVRQEAWDGLIPAEFSMDSQEVTSLERPLPLYVSDVPFHMLPFMPMLCPETALFPGRVYSKQKREVRVLHSVSSAPRRVGKTRCCPVFLRRVACTPRIR